MILRPRVDYPVKMSGATVRLKGYRLRQFGTERTRSVQGSIVCPSVSIQDSIRTEQSLNCATWCNTALRLTRSDTPSGSCAPGPADLMNESESRLLLTNGPCHAATAYTSFDDRTPAKFRVLVRRESCEEAHRRPAAGAERRREWECARQAGRIG